MSENKISRRQFLYTGTAATAGIALAACQPRTVIVEKEKIVKETVQVETEKIVEVEKEVTKVVEVEKEVTKVVEVEKLITPTALPSTFSESPMTAALVADGKLPAVDERLPLEPLVVYPYDEIGQYGGTIRTGALGTGLFSGDCDLVTGRVQNLLRITPNLQEAVPNILKDWSVSPDFKVITCFMRRGMKWSDGAPLTAEDWLFAWEDNFADPDRSPVMAQWFRVGGKPMVVEKLDDFSFRLTFAAANPSFVLVNMAHEYGMWSYNVMPAHYLQQFHKKYNPKADDLAAESDRDFWYQNFGDKADPGLNMELPITRAFHPIDESPERVLHERNAYHFITDTEGNQLPYIDNATLARPADLALHNAKIVGGAYDFAGFDANIQNYQTYDEASEQGGYKILLWRSGKGSDVVYQVNCNWGQIGMDQEAEEEDPVQTMQREIFLDDRFRQALSIAINREEVNEVLYFGNGDPRQMTVIPDSRHFKPEYATAWAQYDPDQANAFLDELGLAWNADKTRRTWPDGSDLIIAWDLYESETPKGPTTELVKEYWGNVGVEIQYKSITRTLLTTKVEGNQEPMSLWHGDETTDVLFLRRAKFFTPQRGDESCWGQLWGQWYESHGERGLEPPDYIKDLYVWMDNYIETDEDEWATKTLESQAEHVWVIGVVGNAPHPLILNKALTNVTADGYWVWDSLWTYPFYPEQWFYKS
jgi:peptide/nickel transport system substrate-binding protein